MLLLITVSITVWTTEFQKSDFSWCSRRWMIMSLRSLEARVCLVSEWILSKWKQWSENAALCEVCGRFLARLKRIFIFSQADAATLIIHRAVMWCAMVWGRAFRCHDDKLKQIRFLTESHSCWFFLFPAWEHAELTFGSVLPHHHLLITASSPEREWEWMNDSNNNKRSQR